MCLSKPGGRCQFEIPINIHQAWPFVCDNLDACFHGFGEDRFKSAFVIRHNADDVNPLGNQVFNGSNLKSRVGRSRAYHPGIHTEFSCPSLDSFLHGIEPGYSPNFYHNPH